ncbi:MAG: universal stress protein [Nitrospirota bacterium]|nr:universal stress protein [Nitrospirota bacterium]
MVKRILVATDGSKYSAGAAREAINFAKKCESQLYAMSAIEINPEFFALASPLFEKTEKAIKKHLERIKARAAKENVECEIIIREGEAPYRLIIEEADKKQADIIVMGRRGRTGLTRLLMGSVTARVIGHTPRKVLVVPGTSSIKWRNIVLATDGSKHSRTAAE